MTDRNHPDLRQGIVDTCQEMNRSGLNQGTSGNLSHRISNGMLITPTSLPYDRMRSEDIVAIEILLRTTKAIIALHPNGAFTATFCGRETM